MKALREESARLRRVVADQMLNIQVLEEANWKDKRDLRESARPPKAWARRASVIHSDLSLPGACLRIVLVPPQPPTERQVRT
jgi:hypothetical protein